MSFTVTWIWCIFVPEFQGELELVPKDFENVIIMCLSQSFGISSRKLDFSSWSFFCLQAIWYWGGLCAFLRDFSPGGCFSFRCTDMYRLCILTPSRHQKTKSSPNAERMFIAESSRHYAAAPAYSVETRAWTQESENDWYDMMRVQRFKSTSKMRSFRRFCTPVFLLQVEALQARFATQSVLMRMLMYL